jgi:hypothetical protein
MEKSTLSRQTQSIPEYFGQLLLLCNYRMAAVFGCTELLPLLQLEDNLGTETDKGRHHLYNPSVL